MMAGQHAAAVAKGEMPRAYPRETALGSLCNYMTHADPARYQPANITFDLLPSLSEDLRKRFRKDRKARHAEVCRLAELALSSWLGEATVPAALSAEFPQ